MNIKEKGVKISTRMNYCLGKNGGVRSLFVVLVLSIFMFAIFTSSSFITSQGTESLEDSKDRILFDIKIIDFESPLKLGKFFEFTYSLKGISEVNDDVEILFGIEKDGEIISSGSDIIYVGSSEERIETTKLFLPSSVESGVYSFYIELDHKDYNVRSHRTIEIVVKGGLARINPSQYGGNSSVYIVAFLIGLSTFILLFIFYLERDKVKRGLMKETKWIKKHKISSLLFVLFIVLGLLLYYSNFIDYLSKTISNLNFVYVLVISSLLIILVILVLARRKLILMFSKLNNKRKNVKISFPKYKSSVERVKKEISFKPIRKKRSVLLPKIIKIFSNITRILNYSLKNLSDFLNKLTREISKSLDYYLRKTLGLLDELAVGIYSLLREIIVLPRKLIRKIYFLLKKSFNNINKEIYRKSRVEKKYLQKEINKGESSVEKLFRSIFGLIINIKNGLIRRFSGIKKKEHRVQSHDVEHVLNKYLEKKPKPVSKNILGKINLFFIKMGNYFSKGNKKSQKWVMSNIKKIEFVMDNLLVSLLSLYRNAKNWFLNRFRSHTHSINPKRRIVSEERRETRLNFKKSDKKIMNWIKNFFGSLKKSKHNIQLSKNKSIKKVEERFEKVNRKSSNQYKKFVKNLIKIISNFLNNMKRIKSHVKPKEKHTVSNEKSFLETPERYIHKINRDVFSILENIFGKRTRGEIFRLFEKNLVNSGKFTHRHLRALRNLVSAKFEFKEYKRNIYHKKEDLQKDTRLLVYGLTSYLRKTDIKIESGTESIIKSYFRGIHKITYVVGFVYGSIGRGVRGIGRNISSLSLRLSKLFKSKQKRKVKRKIKILPTIGELIEKAKTIRFERRQKASKNYVKKVVRKLKTVQDIIEENRMKRNKRKSDFETY